MLQKNGFKIAFLSGGSSGATEIRAENLNIEFCFTCVPNKSEIITKIQKDLGINYEETLFVGDDINDLVVKPFTSLLVAPKNATNLFKKRLILF